MWHSLIFSSDATRLAIFACGLQVFSLIAWWQEKRRRNRRNLDAVGIMPWGDIAAMTGFAAFVLIVIAGLALLQD